MKDNLKIKMPNNLKPTFKIRLLIVINQMNENKKLDDSKIFFKLLEKNKLE